jgi:predicted heme/steroid binding protein
MKRIWIVGVLWGFLWWFSCTTTFAQTSQSGAQTRTFTLEELAQYTGKDGKPEYIAVDGVVYDMTNVPEWSGGKHIGQYIAGKDYTNEIKTIAPHGVSKMKGIPIVGKLVGAEVSKNVTAQSGIAQKIGVFQTSRARRGIARLLGLLNAVLVIFAASLFGLRRVNKHVWANQNNTLKKIIKPLSKLHPYIGMTLVVEALIHGYVALGTIFRVHTGPLAWFIVFLMMLVALLGKKYKIKNWLPVHRALAILLVITIFVHIVTRNML